MGQPVTSTDDRTYAEGLGAFIADSPSSHHAAALVRGRLVEAGFRTHADGEPLDGAADAGGHVLVRDGAVMAWWVPDAGAARGRFRVVGAHTDSPGFRLKPQPMARSAGWAQVGMEVYGGPILTSWLDRDLVLAGRLVLRSGECRLVRTGPLLRIPFIAPHLQRDIDNGFRLDPQRHLMATYAVGEGHDVLGHLCEVAGVERDALVFHEVFAFPAEAPARFGPAGEFLAAARLDNLASVHAGMTALLDLQADGAGEDIAVLAAFDHEEVGSASRSGAQGPLLGDVLEAVGAGLGLDHTAYRAMVSRSLCVSADSAHGVHPSFPELHDPHHQPLLGAGPMLKVNAKQRYVSDALAVAEWYAACERAGSPVQPFVSNNASPCGSTIGPITATRTGLQVVDVGIPLLACHSVREMCAVSDARSLAGALAEFLRFVS